MSSRRNFLKLLGMATIGTASHEALSYIVRRPHSIVHAPYPYLTSVQVSGLNEDSVVSVLQNGNVLNQWRNVDSNFLEMPINVYGPEDESISLTTRRLISMPVSKNGLVVPQKEGDPISYMDDIGDWEESFTHDITRGVLRSDNKAHFGFVELSDEHFFSDLN